MNVTKSITTIVLASLLFISCKKETPETTSTVTEKSTPKIKKEIAPANLQTTNFTIEGMTCEIGCAKTIQEELATLDGVQNASVDFDKKLATVIFDKTVQTPEKLTKVVLSIGDGKTYTISKTKS